MPVGGNQLVQALAWEITKYLAVDGYAAITLFKEGKRNETWSPVLSSHEVREIPLDSGADGNGPRWKPAVWGSRIDQRLLASLYRIFTPVADLEEERLLVLAQGLELSIKQTGKGAEEVEFVEEVVGKQSLDVNELKKMRIKALSLFLSWDFAFYHQFFTSTELDVKRDRATLQALRRMPLPLGGLDRRELASWSRLRAKLARFTGVRKGSANDHQSQLFETFDTARGLKPLLAELNERVFDALGMDQRERTLVHDLVHIRLDLNDGGWQAGGSST